MCRFGLLAAASLVPLFEWPDEGTDELILSGVMASDEELDVFLFFF